MHPDIENPESDTHLKFEARIEAVSKKVLILRRVIVFAINDVIKNATTPTKIFLSISDITTLQNAHSGLTLIKWFDVPILQQELNLFGAFMLTTHNSVYDDQKLAKGTGMFLTPIPIYSDKTLKEGQVRVTSSVSPRNFVHRCISRIKKRLKLL
jgi:hypothetical protein